MMTAGSKLRGFTVGFGAALFLGCATTYMPPLTTRGIPAEERRDYIIQNGYGIPDHVRQAFLDGYVVEGMTKEMVFNLFGAADDAGEKDSHWEYVNRKRQMILGVHFTNDKVDHIDGDPTGGAKQNPQQQSALPGP